VNIITEVLQFLTEGSNSEHNAAYTGLHTFHTYVASIFRFAGPSRLSCVIFTTFSLTATPLG